MKRLQIKLNDKNGKVVETIICEKLDACRSMTIMSSSFVTGVNYSKDSKGNDLHIPEEIDHWNIFEGMVTIYYKSGFFIEIVRING